MHGVVRKVQMRRVVRLFPGFGLVCGMVSRRRCGWAWVWDISGYLGTLTGAMDGRIRPRLLRRTISDQADVTFHSIYDSYVPPI
jgi:hypothetical protein